MPTVKMTDAVVRRLTAPANARIDYFDAAFPGLCLRVTGPVDQRPERRSWTLFYRLNGKQRRLTFAPGYPAMSLAEARQEATKAQLQIRAGTDPVIKPAQPDTFASHPAFVGVDRFQHRDGFCPSEWHYRALCTLAVHPRIPRQQPPGLAVSSSGLCQLHTSITPFQRRCSNVPRPR